MAALSGEVDLAALARERAARAAKDGKPVPAAKKTTSATSSVSAGGASAQKALLILAAVCIGPAILQQLYIKVTTESVDLSDFNVVTQYDTPAIEMMDDTVRIQFCSS